MCDSGVSGIEELLGFYTVHYHSKISSQPRAALCSETDQRRAAGRLTQTVSTDKLYWCVYKICLMICAIKIMRVSKKFEETKRKPLTLKSSVIGSAEPERWFSLFNFVLFCFYVMTEEN